MRILIILAIKIVLLLQTTCGWSATVFKQEHTGIPDNYTAVVRFDDGFVASSSAGRIDWISNAGIITQSQLFSGLKFNSLLVDNQRIIVAGDNGAMMIGSEPSDFKNIETGLDCHINSLALFNGRVIAGADGGVILVEYEDGLLQTIELDLIGDIVSISANSTDCYGVTNKGEIIHSMDGVNWSVNDFNKTYEGFYRSCQFTKVLTTDKQISIIGFQDDGIPVMFLSSLGTVWTQRHLMYSDQNGTTSVLNEYPNDIFYDALNDQYVLICNHGKIMIIPSCSHCNQLFEFSSENLISIAGIEKSIVVVGNNGFIKTERIDYF
jgi:hypothetical protein